VQFRARTVEVADDGGHAGLVAHGGGQVALLLGVILREAVGGRTVSQCLFVGRFAIAAVGTLPLHLSSVTGSALSRQESQRTMARRFELSVRHLDVVIVGVGCRSDLKNRKVKPNCTRR
jgi:hypothetical protein